MLATGGAAALWSRTTNPPGRDRAAGCCWPSTARRELADLELMQFHPTAVATTNGADGFLVTEAVRGEGARLLDAAGERFVDELAPRDEVARAVAAADGADRARARSASTCATSTRRCSRTWSTALRRAGIDPERELVPVAPAAHYMMGGIATDLDGARDAARPVRGRRVLVHGPARRQPARLQLAHRVLRVRRARRPRGARASRRRSGRRSRTAAGRGGGRSRRRRRGAATRCGGYAGPRARRRWAARARGRPASARAADRALGAGAHREPRRAPAPRLPGRPTRRSTAAT